MRFVHLHVHSHYSLLQGLAKIDELILRAKELGMDALALTDSGNLYGAIEFYETAKKHGLKPIIGMEAYLAPESRLLKRAKIDSKTSQIVLLAENETGYNNLKKLSTAGFLEGFYYKPRIDEELLEKHAEGLIALTGNLSGAVPQALINRDEEKAAAIVRRWQKIFGQQNVYLEVAYHPSIEYQNLVNAGLKKISSLTGAPLAAAQDVHYLLPEDKEAQDALSCIQSGKTIGDERRFSLISDDYSLRSPEEMEQFFLDSPEAIANTAAIADRCNLDLELNVWNFPAFPLPDKDADTYLSELASNGLKERITNITPEISNRLDYELNIIKTKGYAAYFLVVADFVNWSRNNNIIATTRGSAAGSLVSYAIGITTVNPLDFRLPFERFLNPYRPSPPDIDMDFADTDRDRVISYVTEKYGADKVAQVCTFGTMMARGSVRDVGRALGYPYSFCDQIAKLIPFGSQGFQMTIAQALKDVPELRVAYQNDERTRRLLDLAQRIEGCARHCSIHAAGVVISPTPLTDFTPLQREAGGGDKIITQYDMHSVELAGLLKMDFLGIRNLSILGKAVELVKALKNTEVNLYALPLNDKRTFELLSKGQTIGLFQLSGSGMTRYLKELKPTAVDDIMAMVALFRPGPMESIPAYIRRKHGLEKIDYLDPRLKTILDRSYGILVYQDDVLLIAIQLAGYNWEEADKLRKAMGKKIPAEMVKQKTKFLMGCEKNGLTLAKAEQLWQLIEPFAAYGFNKCLTGDAEIIDAKTGQIFTIKELFSKNRLPRILSLNNKHKLIYQPITAIHNNGKKPVWTIHLRSGRTVTATATHRFLTDKGWQHLKTLTTGNFIATPRRIPLTLRPYPIADKKLAVLGYLLSEGNLCHPHGIYFYSTKQEELNDFQRAANVFANASFTHNRSKSAVSVYVGKKRPNRPNELMHWVRQLGLHGKRAIDKFFPDFVFRLAPCQLAVLLGKLWQGDGCIMKKYGQIFYATSSYKLARQLQHLLLRLDIRSVLHHANFKYRGTLRRGYQIHVSRYESIQQFANTIGKHLVAEKSKALDDLISRHPILNGTLAPYAARGSFDIVPASLGTAALRAACPNGTRGPLITSTAQRCGMSPRLFMMDKRRKGYLRETLFNIGSKLANQQLLSLGSSDVWWDQIRNISYKGIEETYDLTVDETHNFVTNDIVAHNSHAASYAMVAYQTAYLKANFPTEFMCAILTEESNNLDKVAEAVRECRAMEITVLPPCVNESREEFTIINDKTIRFGLIAVKNIGLDVVRSLLDERRNNGPFACLENFLQRVPPRVLNKKSLESLIRAGALDSLGDRLLLNAHCETLLRYGREQHEAKKTGQESLFAADAQTKIPLPPLEDDIERPLVLTAWEQELLGLELSAHPLDAFQAELSGLIPPINDAVSDAINETVLRIAGVIKRPKTIMTKKNERMMFASLEDQTGTVELVLFPRTCRRFQPFVAENTLVVVEGRLSARNDQPSLAVERLSPLSATTAHEIIASLKNKQPIPCHDDPQPALSVNEPLGAARAVFTLPLAAEQSMAARLKNICEQNPGPTRVFICYQNGGLKPATIATNLSIAYNEKSARQLSALLGEKNIELLS